MVAINIQKKDLFLIGAILVFLIGVGIVIATNSGNPSLMGHTPDEVMPQGTLCGLCGWSSGQGNSLGLQCMGYDPCIDCPASFTKTYINLAGGTYKVYSCFKG